MTSSKTISIRNLCTDISNFFEATPIHIYTNSILEKTLETHKKNGGKNVVLLVSNGVQEETDKTIQLTSKNTPEVRILNELTLVDKDTLKLKKDRSALIYTDVVNCINNKTNSTLPPYSKGYIFSEKNSGSDPEILSQISKELLNNSPYPKFIVGLLNSSFLTQQKQLTQNAKNIKKLIENSNSTGTLYLLTSTNKIAQTKTPNVYKEFIAPLVPLVVAAELLRKTNERHHSVDWKRKQADKIDLSCMYRYSQPNVR